MSDQEKFGLNVVSNIPFGSSNAKPLPPVTLGKLNPPATNMRPSDSGTTERTSPVAGFLGGEKDWKAVSRWPDGLMAKSSSPGGKLFAVRGPWTTKKPPPGRAARCRTGEAAFVWPVNGKSTEPGPVPFCPSPTRGLTSKAALRSITDHAVLDFMAFI